MGPLRAGTRTELRDVANPKEPRPERDQSTIGEGKIRHSIEMFVNDGKRVVGV